MAGQRRAGRGQRPLAVSGGSTRAAGAVFVEQEDVFCRGTDGAGAPALPRGPRALAPRPEPRRERQGDQTPERRCARDIFGLETVADHLRVGAPADARALGGARGLSGGGANDSRWRLRRPVARPASSSPTSRRAGRFSIGGLRREHAGEAGQRWGNGVFSGSTGRRRGASPLRRPGRVGARPPRADGPRPTRSGPLAPPPDIMTLPPAEAILEVAARAAPTAAPALVKAPRRFTTARRASPSGTTPRARAGPRAPRRRHAVKTVALDRGAVRDVCRLRLAHRHALRGRRRAAHRPEGRRERQRVLVADEYRDALLVAVPAVAALGRGLALARREAASGAHGPPLSVLAMQLADVVLQQALPCVFVSVTYRLIDPRHGLEQRLGAFLLVAQAVAFAGASLGYLIACLSPDSECRRPASSSFDDGSRRWRGGRVAHRPLFPRSRDRCGAAVCLPDDPLGRALRERWRDSSGGALDQQGVSPSQQLRRAFSSIYHTPSTRPARRTGQPDKLRLPGVQPGSVAGLRRHRRLPRLRDGKDVLAFFSLAQRSFESNWHGCRS